MSKLSHQERRQIALVQFVAWYNSGMQVAIDNVLELYKIRPIDISNPVLRFLVPRASSNVAERFVLEVFQAWRLLNIELKSQGLRTLGETNREFQHLKRIRDNIVAHGVNNSLLTDRHKRWHKKRYGNYEKLFPLILSLSDRIATKVLKLNKAGRLPDVRGSFATPPAFTAQDVETLLEALKSKGIY